MAKDKKKPKRIFQPVEEHAARCKYTLEAITDKGQVIGRAYRRRPLFETMFDRNELTRDEHYIISYYRQQYDLCNRSLTRDSLAPFCGAGNGSGLIPFTLKGASEVRAMDAAIGAVLPAFLAVAVEDESFNRVAMARWGSKQIEAKNGKLIRQALVPKCRTHPRKIKAEFHEALKRLMPVAHSLCAVNYYVDLCDHIRKKKEIVRSAPAESHNAPETISVPLTGKINPDANELRAA